MALDSTVKVEQHFLLRSPHSTSHSTFVVISSGSAEISCQKHRNEQQWLDIATFPEPFPPPSLSQPFFAGAFFSLQFPQPVREKQSWGYSMRESELKVTTDRAMSLLLGHSSTMTGQGNRARSVMATGLISSPAIFRQKQCNKSDLK